MTPGAPLLERVRFPASNPLGCRIGHTHFAAEETLESLRFCLAETARGRETQTQRQTQTERERQRQRGRGRDRERNFVSVFLERRKS